MHVTLRQLLEEIGAPHQLQFQSKLFESLHYPEKFNNWKINTLRGS